MNSKWAEALRWLDDAERFGMKLDLSNIQTLLETLGNPHEKLEVIHVAGTNGKGSTSAMIASILKEMGFSVGLYTSPHLISPRERIQKNGEWISEKDFLSEIEFLREVVEKLSRKKPFSPTYFELMTAMALDYFARQKLDFVVLETGMGGRLDSTNVVQSRVQVITNIDLEHTKYLGRTIEEIAGEKAGIIKPGSTVITGAEEGALIRIMEEVRKKCSSLMRLGRELKYELKGRILLEGQSIQVRTLKDVYDVEIRLLGRHQAENCTLAIGAIEALGEKGHTVSKTALLTGLKNTCWSGRFEIVWKEPYVVLDAAHNLAGARVLVDTWKDCFGEVKAHLIFSAFGDKDVQSMAQVLAEIADQVDLIQLESCRGMKRSNLKEIWRKFLSEDHVQESDIQKTIALIQERRNSQKPFLITGSIYLLGEFLKVFRV